MNDPKRLILVGCGIAVLIIFSLFIKNHADTEGWKTAYKYNIAITANKADQFNYDVDSKQGLVLSRGEFTAKQGVKFDEMTKAYTYVGRVHEQYTMHTETYECGDSENPRTCTRTYWSWDMEGSDERYSNKITYFGRDYNTRDFGLNRFIEHIEACDITSKDTSGFFEENNGCKDGYYYTDDDNRYYYNTVPLKFTASFITDTSDGTIKSPFGGIVQLERKTTEEMVDDSTGYKFWNNFNIVVCAIFVLIAGSVMGYNWVMADGKWSRDE